MIKHELKRDIARVYDQVRQRFFPRFHRIWIRQTWYRYSDVPVAPAFCHAIFPVGNQILKIGTVIFYPTFPRRVTFVCQQQSNLYKIDSWQLMFSFDQCRRCIARATERERVTGNCTINVISSSNQRARNWKNLERHFQNLTGVTSQFKKQLGKGPFGSVFRTNFAIACKQALLFGRVKQASRERASEGTRKV